MTKGEIGDAARELVQLAGGSVFIDGKEFPAEIGEETQGLSDDRNAPRSREILLVPVEGLSLNERTVFEIEGKIYRYESSELDSELWVVEVTR